MAARFEFNLVGSFSIQLDCQLFNMLTAQRAGVAHPGGECSLLLQHITCHYPASRSVDIVIR